MDGVIAVGDVVQIDPAHDPVFGACFMLVTELKPSWQGLMGFVLIPAHPEGKNAYYRVPIDKVSLIGTAQWVPADLIPTTPELGG